MRKILLAVFILSASITFGQDSSDFFKKGDPVIFIAYYDTATLNLLDYPVLDKGIGELDTLSVFDWSMDTDVVVKRWQVVQIRKATPEEMEHGYHVGDKWYDGVKALDINKNEIGWAEISAPFRKKDEQKQ